MPETRPDPTIATIATIDCPPGPPVATREDLIALLSRASDREHGWACVALFAAAALKNEACEGGLTDAQVDTVRGWRRVLAAAAADRMLHVAQLANLLTAIGGAPHVARPTVPTGAAADLSAPSGVRLTLDPLSQPTLDRLAADERSGDATGGDVYAAIAAGVRALPAEDLFIGPPEAQVDPRLLDLGVDGHLVAVVDQASACAALAAIVGAGAGTGAGASTGSLPAETSVRPGVFATIRAEYAAAVADAQRSGLPFEPARPVAANPTTRPRAGIADGTPITDASTSAVAVLFNDAYDTLLLMLRRVFAHGEESDADRAQLAAAARRLTGTVIRPLGEALARLPVDSASRPGLCAGPPFGDGGDLPALTHHAAAWTLLDERLWRMATAATTLRLDPALPTEVQEATAALQDLACQFAPADGPRGVAAKVAALTAMQAGLDRGIQAAVNGPYLVTNVDTLHTWLGERLPTRPQMALCRCGGAAGKPFCDGTCARLDFTSRKDPARVPDRRDTHIGTAVTVLDNRGLCAHSGFCTDRLAAAFHAGQDPFVVPNAARMDDLVRAVRACPSGALSYALGGVEARDQVDQPRPPAIEVSKDGPYRITGGLPLADGQGADEPRNEGASREHYSLCRCGHSQNKPFCSGMHWYGTFRDPKLPADRAPTLFEWAGGLPALTRMTRLFYDKYVPQDPLLGPLFAHMAPDHPERVATWLGEVFGGPSTYSDDYGGYARMLSQHVGKGLTETQRARWAGLMVECAGEAGLPNDAEFRSAFVSYIEWGSHLAVENSQQDAHPPQHMPCPKWDWGTAGPPGGRVSALAPQPQPAAVVVLPAADEPLHFAAHIKPLFRPMDRQSMTFAFDLWSYDDVTTHADGILARLQKGTMPCDGAWPAEKVTVFQRWVESGKPA